MKSRISNLDSFNFSSKNLEALFSHSNCSIEVVKSIGIFEPKRWLEEFGKSTTQNIIEAKILHINTGLTLAIKRFSVNQDKQTLEFAGLHGYNDKSKLLRELLKEIWVDIQYENITRVDVAIDFKGTIPKRVIKALNKTRTPFQWENSTYLKTDKEKKSNPRINVLMYPKHLRKNNNLSDEVERLEFSFRGGYFNKMQVQDIDKVIIKMQKSIKRLAGLEVDIFPL